MSPNVSSCALLAVHAVADGRAAQQAPAIQRTDAAQAGIFVMWAICVAGPAETDVSINMPSSGRAVFSHFYLRKGFSRVARIGDSNTFPAPARLK